MAIGGDNSVGLFAGPGLLPLIECIDRDDAALAACEGIAKSRLGRDRLSHRVDAVRADLDVLAPPRNQPPPEKIEATPAIMI
jgi:hypothetical protein